MSSAKVNDLKPMLGEAFEQDLLRGYDFWGWLQEDVLVGNLRTMLTSAFLASADVICPFDAPLNSSGTFMLFRNTRRVNRVWRLSRDAQRVLASRSYQTFGASPPPLRLKAAAATAALHSREQCAWMVEQSAAPLAARIARPHALW